MGARIWKLIRQNENMLENIKKKQKKRKIEEQKKVHEEQTKINTKINKFIEEAKQIGKNEAKAEIIKLEKETNEQIKKEEEKIVEDKKALEKEYKEKEVKISEEIENIKKKLIQQIYEALNDYHNKKELFL